MSITLNATVFTASIILCRKGNEVRYDFNDPTLMWDYLIAFSVSSQQFYEQRTHDETVSELDRIRTVSHKAERDR